MKKIFVLILALCLVLSLAACGGSQAPATNPGATTGNQNDNTATPTDPAAPAVDTFTYTFKGVELKLYAEAAPVIAALGEPAKYSESTSCAFDGLDKNYYYGNLYIDTYPENGEDYIYGWWFADDTLATDEGIYIGASQAEVEAAYGADTFNGTNSYVITKGEGTLTVILKDGVVSSIQYAIILK